MLTRTLRGAVTQDFCTTEPPALLTVQVSARTPRTASTQQHPPNQCLKRKRRPSHAPPCQKATRRPAPPAPDATRFRSSTTHQGPQHSRTQRQAEGQLAAGTHTLQRNIACSGSQARKPRPHTAPEPSSLPRGSASHASDAGLFSMSYLQGVHRQRRGLLPQAPVRAWRCSWLARHGRHAGQGVSDPHHLAI